MTAELVTLMLLSSVILWAAARRPSAKWPHNGTRRYWIKMFFDR